MNRSLPFFVVLLMSFAPSLFAGWQLDGDASSIGFISVKNGAVVESHHFNEMSGSITDAGNATVNINLDSVDTMIPIRNERMRAMLFKTETYPEATISVDLDMATYGRIKAGEAVSQEIAGTLSMAGQTATVMVPVIVVRGHNSMVVSSKKPVIINAANWNLTPGIEALRAIAQLTSITPAVPVSFTLKFDRAGK
jgi:polyisoprenoid-binding protein YceI